MAAPWVPETSSRPSPAARSVVVRGVADHVLRPGRRAVVAARRRRAALRDAVCRRGHGPLPGRRRPRAWEVLHVVRATDGTVDKLYFATYAVTRAPLAFAELQRVRWGRADGTGGGGSGRVLAAADLRLRHAGAAHLEGAHDGVPRVALSACPNLSSTLRRVRRHIAGRRRWRRGSGRRRGRRRAAGPSSCDEAEQQHDEHDREHELADVPPGVDRVADEAAAGALVADREVLLVAGRACRHAAWPSPRGGPPCPGRRAALRSVTISGRLLRASCSRRFGVGRFFAPGRADRPSRRRARRRGLLRPEHEQL